MSSTLTLLFSAARDSAAAESILEIQSYVAWMLSELSGLPTPKHFDGSNCLREWMAVGKLKARVGYPLLAPVISWSPSDWRVPLMGVGRGVRKRT